MNMHHLFPIPIGMFDLDRELTDEELLFVRGQDTRPNEGNTTSKNNFVLRDPVMTSLRGWIEDCCDALGSSIDSQQCGTFGTVSCFSFYPAHHLTTIEGGMAVSRSSVMADTIRQFVNWGRACWCSYWLSVILCYR